MNGRSAPAPGSPAPKPLRKQLALRRLEARLYVHTRLIDLYGQLAHEPGYPIVDNIQICDEAPTRYLPTTVHLSEAANLRLAERLYRAISPKLHRGTAHRHPVTPQPACRRRS